MGLTSGRESQISAAVAKYMNKEMTKGVTEPMVPTADDLKNIGFEVSPEEMQQFNDGNRKRLREMLTKQEPTE